MVRSWCQGSAQLLAADLSNSTARTGRACRPSAAAAMAPTAPAGVNSSPSPERSRSRDPALSDGRCSSAVSTFARACSSSTWGNRSAPSRRSVAGNLLGASLAGLKREFILTSAPARLATPQPPVQAGRLISRAPRSGPFAVVLMADAKAISGP